MELGHKLENWAYDACKSILFEPDREAVRQELRCHLQESLDVKLEAGMSVKDAETLVLAEMGSAAPVAEQMAILYRPFWGKLWKRTRLLKNIALVYLALVLISNVYSAAEQRFSYNPDAFLDNIYSSGQVVADIRPKNTVKVVDYTVSVHRMVLFDDIYSDYAQEDGGRTAFLTLKITYQNPWLHTPYFAQNMTATDDFGNSYGIRDYSAQPLGREISGNMAFNGLLSTYMEMWVTDIPPEAARLTFRFDNLGPKGVLTVAIPTRNEYDGPLAEGGSAK